MMLGGEIDFSKFCADVYSVVQQVPAGKVVTYGLIARLIGYPRHSRLVGRAMAITPHDFAVPAWRVVNAQGRTAPIFPQQRQMLLDEGVTFTKSGFVNLKAHLWNPFDIFPD